MSTHTQVWTGCFRVLFRVTPNRLVLRIAGRATSLRIAEVVIVGRVSGIERRYPLTVLDVDGRSYIGHPNGRSQWVRNLAAAGSATIVGQKASVSFGATELGDTDERDAVVRATSQQPFPANLLYRAGRQHVAANGTYFRLEPLTTAVGDQ